MSDMPKPCTWRRSVAFFPPDIRERFGRMCNRLEDEGVPFPESEWRAFQATVKFLLKYEKDHPGEIQYVIPYHYIHTFSDGSQAWVPRPPIRGPLVCEENQLEDFQFLIDLSASLQKIQLKKKGLSDHAKSLHKPADPKRQSPDERKIDVPKRKSGRRFKHSIRSNQLKFD